MRSKAIFAGRASLAVLVAIGALSACGGNNDNGGDSTPAATAQVPASASASATGFIAYLQRLVVSVADTLEPVDTSAVTGPKDETSEPTKVD